MLILTVYHILNSNYSNPKLNIYDAPLYTGGPARLGARKRQGIAGQQIGGADLVNSAAHHDVIQLGPGHTVTY